MQKYLLFALLLLALAVPAGAATINQQFRESGVIYNRIDMVVIGGLLNGTGISGFTNGTWGINVMSPTWVYGTTSPAISNTNFDVSINTAGVGYIDLFAFNGSVLVDSARFAFDSQRQGIDQLVYSRTPGDIASYQSDVQGAVPEPATLGMLGGGLVFLGWVGRRRTKA